MTTNTDEPSDDEIVFDTETENGDELNLATNQREVLTRAGDPTCAICNQTISEIDDSAVDHIEQYWQGGKTIPENARLTHRYCNNARPRSDSPQSPQ